MKKSEKLISAIATIAFGLLLIILGAKFIKVLMTLAGIGLIILGVIDLLNRFIPLAVIKIVVGVFVIICGLALIEAVLYVVAAVLLIAGILLLYDKVKHGLRCATLAHTIMEYASPSLLILIGILLLFHQGAMINAVFIISGILTIIEGGLVILNALWND